jgi:hypothetical protein
MEDQNLNSNVDNNNVDNNDVVKDSYTKEEVEKLLQSEADRRIAQAQKKWEKESSKKVSEAEKLAKMNEEDRYKYELEQRDSKLAAREKEFALKLNENEALKVMDSRKIPASLVELVVCEDAEEMMKRINLIEEVIKNAVSEQVRDKLKSPTPNTATKTGSLTKEDFRKMNIAERSNLLTSNRKLYEELSK